MQFSFFDLVKVWEVTHYTEMVMQIWGVEKKNAEERLHTGQMMAEECLNYLIKKTLITTSLVNKTELGV